MDARFLDDRHERFLGRPTRLQEAREIAASPQLGNPEIGRAGPRFLCSIAIAVAGVRERYAPLAIGRPAAVPDIEFHEGAASRIRASHAAYRGRGGSFSELRECHTSLIVGPFDGSFLVKTTFAESHGGRYLS